MSTTIWAYWGYMWQIIRVRDYMENSYLFALYEGPVMTVFYGGWPWLHLALAGLYVWCVMRVSESAKKFDEYYKTEFVGTAGLLWLPALLVPYLLAATIGGGHIATYKEIARANPTLVPRVLPAEPPPLPPLHYDRVRAPNSPYVVPVARAQVAFDMSIAARQLRTALDFLILFTPLPLLFLLFALTGVPRLIFSFAYAREIARPHLPTEIVDRALSGGHIDQHALANAFTQSTAPVVPDSLADKVERERLAALAARLQADASALDNKLSKEAEIARLVVSHARKREELADMEKKLRDMGVKRNG